MKIQIQAIDFKATKQLIDFVTEKVEGLSHLNKNILGVKVHLRLDKSSTGENKICEMSLDVPGNYLFVKRKSESFEDATKQSVEAMQKQIKKIKTKLENHFSNEVNQELDSLSKN